MNGIVLKYNQKNINTDLIIPARYLTNSDSQHLASHCMEDLDRNFKQKKEELNATIIVADSNFGCGSSREQAPIALKTAGVKCIIAPSYARIFYRNAINIGLPIIEFQDISMINTGDELEINFNEGNLKNITNASEFKINKMPKFLQEIISIGGLVNYAKKKILEK
ncbi:MAG: 3-isopropylmalate dehydratase small subunit [Candidatus Lokiarchaeota archaeon]|nr:3-isopropylmalate dehydratase small subunit [Candidatus Lokiarchaeota archaeon]